MTPPKPRCEKCNEILYPAARRNPDGTTTRILRCPKCGVIRLAPQRPRAPASPPIAPVDSRRMRVEADEFRRRRIELGWSQKGFAEYIGYDKGVVNKWERGKNPVPLYALRILELLELLEVVERLDLGAQAPDQRS